MKLICDTNIWYALGQDKTLFERVKDLPIYPTYANITELGNTINLIEKEEIVRLAIQRLFHFRNNPIFEPPFIYLAKLNCNFEYDLNEITGILQFTEKFAKGITIQRSKEDEFLKILQKRKQGISGAAKWMNEFLEKVRPNIKNKKQHRKKDTENITAQFLNFCVEVATRKKCSLKGLELTKIELLVGALNTYFKNLELSANMKVDANDFFDWGMLAYVQPGDKFWTLEKRWLKIIEQSGMSDYLFDNNETK